MSLLERIRLYFERYTKPVLEANERWRRESRTSMKNSGRITRAVGGTYPRVFRGVTVKTTLVKRGRTVIESAK